MANALSAALSGIRASLTRADVSANNVANVNTTAFRSSRVDQAERYGGGTQVSAITRNATPGAPQTTERPLDIAVQGRGLIRVEGPRGVSYTRDGSLRVDANGFLTTAEGNRVGGGIRVPVGSNGVRIDVTGDVYAQFNDRERLLGRVQFEEFANFEGMRALGSNRYAASVAAGTARPSPSTVETGVLEGSNTDLATEVIQQIAAQMGVSANVDVIRTADDLQGTLLDMVK